MPRGEGLKLQPRGKEGLASTVVFVFLPIKTIIRTNIEKKKGKSKGFLKKNLKKNQNRPFWPKNSVSPTKK